MMLGARWRVGELPHRGVPPTLHDTVQGVEQEFPEAHSWTLTWLENRPVLALDDVATVTMSFDGSVQIRRTLADSHNTQSEHQASVSDADQQGVHYDDDDDDWLS